MADGGMDVARLGIIVDANGARREISLTSAELAKLADQSVRTGAALGGSSGPVPPSLPPRIDRVTQAIVRMRAAAAQRIDLGLAQQIALLDPFQQQVTRTTGTLARISPVATTGRLSLGRLGNQFAGLAGSIAGVHPVVGNVLGVMGNFAIGSPWTVGILLGIAAIAVAYDLITRGARKAREENERLIKSMEEQLRLKALGPGAEFVDAGGAAREELINAQRRRDSLAQSNVGGWNDREIAKEEANIERMNKLIIGTGKARFDAAMAATTPLKTVEVIGRNIKKDAEDAAKAEKQFADNIQRAKDASLALEFAAVKGSQSIEQQKVEALKLRDAARQGAAAYEAAADEIEIMNNLAAAGIPIFDHRYEAAKRELETARDARRETEMRLKLDKQVADDIVEAQKATADAQAQISENLTREMQENFSTFFQNTLTDGLSSFRKLFSGIRDMFIKLVSDLLAARLMQRFGGAIAGVLGGAVGAGAAGAGGETAGIAGLGGAMLAPVGIGVAGGMIGYQLGQGARSGLGGGLRGAAGGALAGAAIGSIVPGIGTAVGAFIGGVTGFVGGVLGAGKAARESAREMKKLQEQLALTMEGWRANLRGDVLGAALAESTARLKAMLLAINAAYSGTANERERNRLRAEAEALQREEAQQIREQHEQQRQYAREDLQVRMLRAQGQNEEADALAFANQQQREYTAAVQAGADAAYLAMLTQVQAAEAVARAIGTLQDAVRNAPSGFKIDPYTYEFGVPRGGPDEGVPIEGPTMPPVPQPPPAPQPPGGGGGGPPEPLQMTFDMRGSTFEIVDSRDPERTFNGFIGVLRRKAAVTVGPNAPLSRALDFAR